MMAALTAAVLVGARAPSRPGPEPVFVPVWEQLVRSGLVAAGPTEGGAATALGAAATAVPIAPIRDTTPSGRAPAPGATHAHDRPSLESEPDSRPAATTAPRTSSSSGSSSTSGSGTSGTSSSGWAWPIVGQITQGFGADHRGIDILADAGDAVRAAHAGRVTEVGYLTSCGGLEIRMDIGGGMDTRYMHLSAESVSVGESVALGEVIGRVGATGCATGTHLHLGVRVDGTYVDPLRYLPSR